MANLMQLLNKSSIVNNKAKILTNNLTADYNQGKIKNDIELIYRTKNVLLDFFDNLNKPLFKYIEAKGTPISDDYNSMINNAIDDVNIVVSECENLSNEISNSLIDNNLIITTLSNKFNYLKKKNEDINNKSTNYDGNEIIISDLFLNKSIMQNTDDKSANINIVDKVMTLGTIKNLNLSNLFNIDIVSGNGFPGNTHAVNSVNNDIHFDGENNIRNNLNSIKDSNNDTWFEYEVFKVSEEVITKANGYGFEYKENISWITEDNELKLRLKLYLDVPQTCSWISLNPYLNESVNTGYSTIDKIIISDSKSETQVIKNTMVFDENIVVTFKPQEISYIIIDIKCNSPYKCNIGHFYYKKINNINNNVFNSYSNDLYIRVDGPNPSISAIGIKYDPSSKQIAQLSTKTQERNMTTDSFIKTSLFNINTKVTSSIEKNLEVFEAYRYMIGIKNINISNTTFKTYSEYISNNFTFNDSVAAITLEADEFIPQSFNDLVTSIEYADVELVKSKKYGINGWIKYFLSFDSGETWHPIFPKHRSFNGFCTYKINSDIPKALRSRNVGYFDRIYDITNIKVKIVLTRPEDEIYKTPIVYNYKLKVFTGDDNIEY